MELTTMERVKLLETLPKQEDILSLKILRKLKETLSFSEEELSHFDCSYEYACQWRRTDKDGKMERCTNKGFFKEQPNKEQPTCGVHNEKMAQTGQMTFFVPPEYQMKTKEIYMGAKALSIASSGLKRLNDSKHLTEEHVSLYEKFFPPEEEDAVPDSKA